MHKADSTTITAIATPPGRGGIGIIRVSGKKVTSIAQALLGKLPKPRYATFSSFLDNNNSVIDQGLALYFPAPHSFTGEDVLELHGHGGVVILDLVLKRVLALGAQLARPGEFSERAFLNDKLDLAQAEAIADLIDAASQQAARSAMRSLQGEFSQHIHTLVDALIQLRIFVEAAIDFPEEEIDFLSDGKIANHLQAIINQLIVLQKNAQQGVLLREGMKIVIAGRPNAGKSSLLNALSGQPTAIVTEIPGTTRDVLREHIQIDGLPLHIVDTAGLRESTDIVEQEGIRRAHAEILNADIVLLIIDSNTMNEQDMQILMNELPSTKLTLIYNKIDLINEKPNILQTEKYTIIKLSAKTNSGIDLLREHLKTSLGYNADNEHTFIARRRHLNSLENAYQHLLQGQHQLEYYKAGELLAEELRGAQQALSEVTGEFRADDLLGKIFSSFCIGK
jgi:tRNA modification GTPase